MKRRSAQVTTRGTLGFFTALGLVSGAFYAILWAADFAIRAPSRTPWALFSHPDAAPALLGLTEVTVAVLGVALTVVAIIVELAATRYTPRLSEIFLKDRTNIAVLSGFVICTLLMMWTSLSLSGSTGPHPRALVLGSVASLSAALLMLLPYFAYVFDFLSPTQVVGRLASDAVADVLAVSRGARDVAGRRAQVASGLEQLGDVALKSVQHMDKGIAVAAIHALQEIVSVGLATKQELPLSWFETANLRQEDTDLVAFHPDVVEKLATQRVWLEMKALLQCRAAFDEALMRQRDVCHLIAIELRRLGTKAAAADDPAALDLMMRFFNTFLRAAINRGDVRTAYNLLNEYRLLGEALVRGRHADVAVRVAERMKLYGQIAFGRDLPFVLETVAYDLCTLIEQAMAEQATCHGALLEVFLDVDRPPDGPSPARIQEASLRGVRKAQIKLATFYLCAGEVVLARRIADDLSGEPRSRLAGILVEILSTTEAEFWEVSDRGVNFDYLTPSRRAQLGTFFGWLGVTVP